VQRSQGEQPKGQGKDGEAADWDIVQDSWMFDGACDDSPCSLLSSLRPPLASDWLALILIFNREIGSEQGDLSCAAPPL